ncbi:MAG: DNA primase [Mangrovibacterium sp.]
MIPQYTIDRIIETAQIVDVVSEFVSLRKSGANFSGLCPFHNERSPSFSVNPSRNICKCFSCGEGGNPVSFLMKHLQMTFPEALRWLANKYNIEIEEEEENDEQKQERDKRESMMLVTDLAQKYFSKELLESNEGRTVGLSYLRHRGLTDDVIKKFNLGYCPDNKDTFTQHALKEGYRMEYLEATGLTVKRDAWVRDRFSGRVMFPIHGVSGRVIGFGGRTLKADEKAKYLNSPESEIYHKSKVLYGLYQSKQTISKLDKCFLVEGYTDVISMHQAGITNVVASSGTALTEDQIRLIKRFTENVTVIYDGDAAGIKAALRGIDLILKEDLKVKVLLLPDGEDPDSFSRSMGATELEEYINANETDFVGFKTKLLLSEVGDDPIAKTRLINDIIGTIAVVPDSIARQMYIQECSRLLKVSEASLLDAVKKKLNNQFEDWQKQQARQAESERRAEAYAQATAQAATSAQNQPALPSDLIIPQVQKNLCEVEERELLRVLLRYFYEPGIRQKDDQGNTVQVMVGDYVLAELDNDELSSTDELVNGMLQIFRDKQQDEASFEVDEAILQVLAQQLQLASSAFHSETGKGKNAQLQEFIAQHEEARINRLAVDIFSNEYIASRRWERNGEIIEQDKELLFDALAVVVLGHNLRNFFLNHPDPKISHFTSDILAEKYYESRRWVNSGAFVEHEYEILGVIVPKVLMEYKLRKIRLMLSSLEQRIAEVSALSDWDSLLELQGEYVRLKSVVSIISKELGSRTIL